MPLPLAAFLLAFLQAQWEPPSQASSPPTDGRGPVVRGGVGVRVKVGQGSLRLLECGEVRTLDRLTPSATLQGERGWIETGARSTIELTWRGLASATICGPAAFELARRPGLELEAFQLAEIEVRRDELALDLRGLGVLELSAGALQVRSLGDGVFELHNRGGALLELRRGGEPPVRIQAGSRVRLRAIPSARGRGPSRPSCLVPPASSTAG